MADTFENSASGAATRFGLVFGTVHLLTCPFTRLVAVLCFALTTTPLRLAAQTPSNSSTSDKTDSQSKQNFSQEPAVYEYTHVSMRYENDGSGTRESRGRIHIQTAAGLAAMGQLIFQYNAVDEQVEIRSVRVLKLDGTTITAGPDAVQDLSAPVTREAPMYTDARQKHVTVPGLSIGDSIEYDVLTTAKPILPGQFWQIWTVEQAIIAFDEQLDVSVPADRPLKIKSSEGIESSNHLDGDRRLYHWSTSNLKTPPPIDIFKDFKFDVIKLLEGNRPTSAPRVMFSTFQNWTDISNWYAQLESDRRVPTPEIRAKADEIVRGQTRDVAKAEALYYWVSQNIRYVSLSFGVGRYQPHPAAQVLANRYGDCKDKTTLLEAMLEAEGLHANPVLANLKADVDPELPSPLQFDHVLTFLRLGSSGAWLDTTLGVGPFGYLAPQLRDKEVLVVSASSPEGLQKTPQDIRSAVEYRVGVDGTVDVDGTLDATVELQTRGDLEVLIRLLNNHLSQDQLAKTAGSVLGRTNRFLYDSVRYTDFKVMNASDISHPVKAQFHVVGKLMYVNPRKATFAALTVALTDLPIKQWQLLSLLPEVATKYDAHGVLEHLDIDLRGPRVYSFDVKLAFATLVKSDVPPPGKLRIENKFAAYESSDQWKDNTFHASRSLTLDVPTVPSSDSKVYASFVQKVVDATVLPISWKNDGDTVNPNTGPSKSKSLTPPTPAGSSHVPATEIQDLYKKGQDEAKRKNWANAAEDFGSAVKADPQYVDAWRELGRAHMSARQYPDAESAFQKYLLLAPDDYVAYASVAWALYHEKKFAQEADLLVKRVAAAPNDGDALFRLGGAYLELHQPEKAVPVLERSTVQLPKSAYAHLGLGRAYLETHQDSLALERFRRVLTLDDSDSMLNTIAYLLAEHDSSLDFAQTSSEGSIAVIEKELNDSSLATAGPQTWMFVYKLGQYWDTLGWIKFQQGKIDEACRYALAAWQTIDDIAVDLHLGRIYEKQGRKDDAAQMYLGALNAVPVGDPPNDDAKEARARLTGILGTDAQVDVRLEQSRKKRSINRTVTIPNSSGLQGIGQYRVIISRNSKVLDLAPTVEDDALTGLSPAIRAASMPQSFPDNSLQKLPRLSTLACPSTDQPCSLTLIPVNATLREAQTD